MTSIAGRPLSLGHARALFVLVAACAGSWSCAPSGFQDPSLLQNGVRILASSATEPYANVGDTVGLSVLAFDGRTPAQRAQNPEPMHVYWLTTLCVNPLDDAYYACFPQVAAEFAPFESDAAPLVETEAGPSPDATTSGDGGNDGGAFDGGGEASNDDAEMTNGSVDGGLDAAEDDSVEAGPGASTSAGPVVSRVDISIPAGIVEPRVGSPSYGLLIKFNVACAGHLQLLPVASSNQNPQALPIGCFDSEGHVLGPESYVFGFTRVYVYDPSDPADPATTNHNPVIVSVDTPQPNLPDGAAPLAPPPTLAIDGGEGPPNLTAAGTFIAPNCAPGANCDSRSIGANLLPSSWELAGHGQHEEIWADYYSTFGSFKSATRLIFDPIAGAIADPDTQFQPPVGQSADQRNGYLWVVVHDNRGGAAWVTVPVQLQ